MNMPKGDTTVKCEIKNVVELPDGSANADVEYDEAFKMEAIAWHAANCNKYEDDSDKVVDKFVLHLLEEGIKHANRDRLGGKQE